VSEILQRQFGFELVKQVGGYVPGENLTGNSNAELMKSYPPLPEQIWDSLLEGIEGF
jgi:hypothetical protein